MLIQSSATVTASTQTDDVLVNNVLATNFRRPFIVEYALVASATGLLIDLYVGLNRVTVGISPSLQNRVPIYPDDYNGRFGVIPGDRIILTARETSGSNRTLYYAFRFNPYGG